MDYQNCEKLYEALETVKKACDGQFSGKLEP